MGALPGLCSGTQHSLAQPGHPPPSGGVQRFPILSHPNPLVFAAPAVHAAVDVTRACDVLEVVPAVCRQGGVQLLDHSWSVLVSPRSGWRSGGGSGAPSGTAVRCRSRRGAVAAHWPGGALAPCAGSAWPPPTTPGEFELYYEIRGTGPPVLLIMGATGDAGHFDVLAGSLAGEFTVVSYDRRGNGRSPRPAGWATTIAHEQAADAAGLLSALRLAPAAVFGTSSGATFALCLTITRPELAGRGSARAGARAARRRPKRGPRPIAAGGLERFWRLVAGDANPDRLEPGYARGCWPRRDVLYCRGWDVRESSAG